MHAAVLVALCPAIGGVGGLFLRLPSGCGLWQCVRAQHTHPLAAQLCMLLLQLLMCGEQVHVDGLELQGRHTGKRAVGMMRFLLGAP